MVVVKESTLKAQLTIKEPEVIQLNKIVTWVSKGFKNCINKNQEKIVENKSKIEDINWESLSPKIFPKKIQYKKPINGKKTIAVIKITPLIY